MRCHPLRCISCSCYGFRQKFGFFFGFFFFPCFLLLYQNNLAKATSSLRLFSYTPFLALVWLYRKRLPNLLLMKNQTVLSVWDEVGQEFDYVVSRSSSSEKRARNALCPWSRCLFEFRLKLRSRNKRYFDSTGK